MMYLTTQGIRKWIKTLAFLNHFYLHFLSPLQHPHRLRLRRCRLLPPSHMQVDQSRIIGFWLAMKTSTLSLCNHSSHSRRRMNNQLRFCHACVSLYAIDCERLQIASAYCENTSTGPPLIPTLSFLRRIFTKLELTLYLCRHHLQLLFTVMNQSK